MEIKDWREIRKAKGWVRKFAWFPVRIHDWAGNGGDWLWLEPYEVQLAGWGGVRLDYSEQWETRKPPTSK